MQGKIERKKINAQRAAQKNVLAYGKKYSCKGKVNEKKIRAARKFPTPRITFLMVRP